MQVRDTIRHASVGFITGFFGMNVKMITKNEEVWKVLGTFSKIYSLMTSDANLNHKAAYLFINVIGTLSGELAALYLDCFSTDYMAKHKP